MIKRIRRHSSSGVALVVLSILGSVAQAQAVTDFDLPAQSLGEALRAIAGQTNSNILFDRQMVSGLSVKALKAQMTTEEALERLLIGTGLAFKYLDEKTVTIVPAGASTTFHRTVLAGTNAGVTLLAGQAGAAQSAAGNDGRRLELEEIIVTAQKRKETLRDIPQSVTVISGKTLERRQADNLQDYVGLIPGLSIQSSARGTSRVTLRGINTGGVASSVAVYLDEVPFGASGGLSDAASLTGDFDTLDLDRLEVLRGPQGTLYGANALGGVLKFVTKEPQTDAFTANLQTSVEEVSGGDLNYAGTGTVNIPLGEQFAVRASGFYRRDGGFIDSIGAGPIFEFDDGNLPGPPRVIIPGSRIRDNLNEVKTYGGRVSGLFKATDALSVRLTAMLQNIDSATSNYVEADRVTLEPLFGRPTLAQYHPEFTDTEYRVYSATVDWDLGFGNLSSSSSYSTLRQGFLTDLYFGAASIVTSLFGDPVTRPLGAIVRQGYKTDEVTQELRLASPDNDRFEWLIGTYYTHEKAAIDRQQTLAVEAATGTIPTDIPILGDAFLKSIYREYAGFANATWHFTPRFDLSFGGRWSRNEQEADIFIGGLLNGPVDVVIPDSRSADDVFTYSVAPRFDLSDTASLYARVASGYRPGGPNIIPPQAPPGTPRTYDADRITNYELGIKADWFNRALSFDIAAYFLDWKDIQVLAVINQTVVNSNGGTAVSKGVEFQFTARPWRGLTLLLDGAYADAYLTEDTGVVTGGFNGDPLPYVPDWSLNLSGDYEWTVLNDSVAYIGGSVRYVGRQTTDFDVRTPTQSLRQIPTYEVFDLRVGLKRDRWSLEAYAMNIGNKNAVTTVFDGSFPNGGLATGIIRPRQIGLAVGVQFQ